MPRLHADSVCPLTVLAIDESDKKPEILQTDSACENGA